MSSPDERGSSDDCDKVMSPPEAEAASTPDEASQQQQLPDHEYRGVKPLLHTDAWIARTVSVSGRRKFLGCFHSKAEAARAYDLEVLSSQGHENAAFLNFPLSDYVTGPFSPAAAEEGSHSPWPKPLSMSEVESEVARRRHHRSLEKPAAGAALSQPSPSVTEASTRFRGVSFYKPTGRWHAELRQADGRVVNLGSYPSEVEAAQVFDRATIHTLTSQLATNFPVQEYFGGFQYAPALQSGARTAEAMSPARPAAQGLQITESGGRGLPVPHVQSRPASQGGRGQAAGPGASSFSPSIAGPGLSPRPHGTGSAYGRRAEGGSVGGRKASTQPVDQPAAVAHSSPSARSKPSGRAQYMAARKHCRAPGAAGTSDAPRSPASRCVAGHSEPDGRHRPCKGTSRPSADSMPHQRSRIHRKPAHKANSMPAVGGQTLANAKPPPPEAKSVREVRKLAQAGRATTRAMTAAHAAPPKSQTSGGRKRPADAAAATEVKQEELAGEAGTKQADCSLSGNSAAASSQLRRAVRARTHGLRKVAASVKELIASARPAVERRRSKSRTCPASPATKGNPQRSTVYHDHCHRPTSKHTAHAKKAAMTARQSVAVSFKRAGTSAARGGAPSKHGIRGAAAAGGGPTAPPLAPSSRDKPASKELTLHKLVRKHGSANIPLPTIRFRKGLSLYRGVTFHQRRWKAQLVFGKNVCHIGLFSSEVEAAQAFDSEVVKIWGPSAKSIVNFSISDYPKQIEEYNERQDRLLLTRQDQGHSSSGHGKRHRQERLSRGGGAKRSKPSSTDKGGSHKSKSRKQPCRPPQT